MARLTECCCSVSAATTETKDQRGKWDDEKQKRDDLNGRKICKQPGTNMSCPWTDPFTWCQIQ